MPRVATIKPTQIKSRKDQGFSSWCLSIPENLSETGKRQRIFFETKREADTAAEIVRTRKENFGVSLSRLSPVQLTEAAEALYDLGTLLQGHDRAGSETILGDHAALRIAKRDRVPAGFLACRRFLSDSSASFRAFLRCSATRYRASTRHR